MTNEQIIQQQSEQLAKAGKIAFTGRVFRVPTEGGGEIEIPETEAIHTFATWKELGFMVKKGEKAVARFPVWKFREGKEKDDPGKMFMKSACFFSASQVCKISSLKGAENLI